MSVEPAGISDTPSEILDRILDFLHNDPPALYSASLVSRQWVAAPRYHLFHQTIVKEYSLPHRGFIRILEESENVHAFLALARSVHCTILPVIRRLILMIMNPELVSAVIDILVLSNATPAQIIYIHNTPQTTISWNADVLQSVHDFTFEMPWAIFGNAAWALVASFPGLRTLAVYTNPKTAMTLPTDLSFTVSAFRHIRALRLRLRASEELLEWLTRLDGSLLPLETLDLRVFRWCHRGWGPVKALNAFLERVSGTLNDLSLGIDLGGPLVMTGPPVDLSPLVHLSSLFLRTHDLLAVCDALASLPSSSELRVLVVHIPPSPWVRMDACDCDPAELLARCAQIMEGPPFGGMTLLDLNVEGWVELESVAEIFAIWKERGLLKLSSTKNDGDSQENSLRSLQPHIYTLRRE